MVHLGKGGVSPSPIPEQAEEEYLAVAVNDNVCALIKEGNDAFAGGEHFFNAQVDLSAKMREIFYLFTECQEANELTADRSFEVGLGLSSNSGH